MATNLPDNAFPRAYNALLDQIPFVILAYNRAGYAVAYNRAAEHFWGRSRDQVVGIYNMLTDPQNAHSPAPELFARALSGEASDHPIDIRYEHQNFAAGFVWLRVTYFPIRIEQGEIDHIGVIYRDVTALIEQATAINEAREALSLQGQLIQDLSSPVARIWEGIVFLPLIGSIDTRRATLITEQLLTALVENQADIAIIDISGVPLIDTAVATYLLNAIRAASLLGSTTILVGIRSTTAQTITDLEIDLAHVVIRADLQGGIAAAFERKGLEVRACSSVPPSPGPLLKI